MQTSSRNQFLGTVTKVTNGPINSEVVLDIGGGNELVAVITHNSVDLLGLVAGVPAYALIKAPWVILAKDDGKIKTSARNNLQGTISSVQEGAVNSEVIITLAGGRTITAIVTNESAKEMALKTGDLIHALIKASHIILAVSA